MRRVRTDMSAQRPAAVGVAALSALIIVLAAGQTLLAQNNAAPAAKPQLPSGFKPPRAVPEFFTIEDEKIQEEDFTKWNREERSIFQEALRAQSLDATVKGKLARKWIEDGVRMRVYRMTLQSERNNLPDLRRQLLQQDIDFNVKSNETVRGFALTQIRDRCQDLLTGNFHVRFHAILLINDLNIVPAGIGLRAKPAVAFGDGLPALYSVLQEKIGDQDVPQPEALKIPAAHGIRRLLDKGNIPQNNKRRVEAARLLLTALGGNNHPTYDRALILALAESGVSLVPDANNAQKPEIVTALAKIVADPKRPMRLRCEAARALGRTPMAGAVKGAPIAFAIVQLAREVSAAYGTNLSRVEAVFCLQDIYFAFNPPKGESTSDGQRRAGLLSTLSHNDVRTAYRDIVPILQLLLKGVQQAGEPPSQIPPTQIQKLAGWKKPQSMSIWNNDPPIDAAVNAAKAAVNAANGAGNSAQPANSGAGANAGP